MKICEENAKQLFLKQFPDGEGIDFAGRLILIDYYNVDCSEGWNIDHILPESKGGKSTEGNLQCANIISNRNKADKTTWIDNNRLLQVRKVKGKPDTYKIVKIKDVYLLEKLPNDIINADVNKAREIFLKHFQSGVGYDFAGRKIRLEDYKKSDSAYGWALGYILSNIHGGKQDDSNIAIFNYCSLVNKGHKQSWEDSGYHFQVRKYNGKYSIVEVYHSNGKTYLKSKGE